MKVTMLLSLVAAVLFPIGMMHYESRIKSRIKVVTFAAYILAILCLTVFREPSNAGRQINLHIFWSYGLFCHADVRWQIYMNVFLFIPFGFLIPWATKKNNTQTLLIGLLFSAGIELTQFILKLGLCEFDDVFHNTLGTELGYGYWKMLTLNKDRINRAIQRMINWFFKCDNKSIRTPAQKELLNALSASLSQGSYSTNDKGVLEEAAQQSVLPLICSGKEALSYIAANVQLMWEQDQLNKVLAGIPFIVLKGSCASFYYPEPLRRTLGDIDLLVGPEHFEAAYDALRVAGYMTNEPVDGISRHVHLKKGSTLIELHRRFAVLQTKDQEMILDSWLFNTDSFVAKINNYAFPMPDHELNGLVLLTHINQHLEEGLGLRQIVDFVMYIKAELTDEKWPAFKEKTDRIGLTTLAKVVGKLGKMYLGLPSSISWCDDAKETTVEKLLDYIFACGNFGHKDAINNTMVMVMSHGRGVKGFFKNLQQRGMENWKLLQKAPWLKPLAWLYQLCRYVCLGVRAGGLRHLKKNAMVSRERNKLMDELRATRLALK